ncbi:replication-relaxation family protein [Thermaerobacter litoralis]
MDELHLPVVGIRPDGRLEDAARAAPAATAAPPAEAERAEESGGLRRPFVWQDGYNSWVSGLQTRWSDRRLKEFLEQAPIARQAELIVQCLGVCHALARHQLWRTLWPETRQRKSVKRLLDRLQEIGVISRWHWGQNGLEVPESHYMPVYVLGPSGRQLLDIVRSSVRQRPGLVRDTRAVLRFLCANEIWSWLARDRRRRLKGWQTAAEVTAGGETLLYAARFGWVVDRTTAYTVFVDVLRGARDVVLLPDRVVHLERWAREEVAGEAIPLLWLVAETPEQALEAEALLWERGLGSDREDGIARVWIDDAQLFSRQCPTGRLYMAAVEGDALVAVPAEVPGLDGDVDPAVTDQLKG